MDRPSSAPSRAPRVLPDQRAPRRHQEPAEEDRELRHARHLRQGLQLQHLRLPLHDQLLQLEGRRHRLRAHRTGPAEGVGAVGPAAAAAEQQQPAAGPEGTGDEEALDAEDDDAAAVEYVNVTVIKSSSVLVKFLLKQNLVPKKWNYYTNTTLTLDRVRPKQAGDCDWPASFCAALQSRSLN